MSLNQPFETVDDFYGEGDTSVKYKLRHFGKFKILVVVTTVLAILLLIFVVLFAVEKGKKSSTIREKGEISICKSRDCLFTAYGEYLMAGKSKVSCLKCQLNNSQITSNHTCRYSKNKRFRCSH